MLHLSPQLYNGRKYDKKAKHHKMKLSEIDLTWILIPVVIAGIVFSKISKFKTGMYCATG